MIDYFIHLIFILISMYTKMVILICSQLKRIYKIKAKIDTFFRKNKTRLQASCAEREWFQLIFTVMDEINYKGSDNYCIQ